MKAREADLGNGLDRVRVRVCAEQHAFRCGECGRRWISTYHVRDYVGPTGARWVVHCRDGEPVPAPHFGDICPECGRVSVTFDAKPEGPSTEPRVGHCCIGRAVSFRLIRMYVLPEGGCSVPNESDSIEVARRSLIDPSSTERSWLREQTPPSPIPLSEVGDRNLIEFDTLSEDERCVYDMQSEKIERLVILLRRYRRGHRLADVGSFTGYATLQYAMASGAADVTCFDLSRAALERCSDRGLETIHWNAEEPCPASDDSYDMVVAADLIEHLVNTDGFLCELGRIICPGGLLLITTPNLLYWLNRIRVLRGWAPWSYPGVSSSFRKCESIDLNHIRINVPSEWRAFFEKRGFNLLGRAGYSVFHRARQTRWGRLRSHLDRVIDDRIPDLSFGNIYVLERTDRSGCLSVPPAGDRATPDEADRLQGRRQDRDPGRGARRCS